MQLHLVLAHRLSRTSRTLAALVCVVCLAPVLARAVPVVFDDVASYDASVGTHSVVDFQSFPNGTILTTQLAALGLIFSDGDDRVVSDPSRFQDRFGYRDLGSSTLLFSSPQNHFGVEFSGGARVELYDGVTLLFSGVFGGAGTGFFAGILDLDTPFDRVVLTDFVDGQGFYDNLHFGFTSIPEPGTGVLLALGVAGLACRRRA